MKLPLKGDGKLFLLVILGYLVVLIETFIQIPMEVGHLFKEKIKGKEK